MRTCNKFKTEVYVISPKLRELIHKVVDGRNELLPLIHYFTAFIKCEQMLEWCIEHKIIGKDLYEWTNHKWGIARLPVVEFLHMKIENRTEPRRLYAFDLNPHAEYQRPQS